MQIYFIFFSGGPLLPGHTVCIVYERNFKSGFKSILKVTLKCHVLNADMKNKKKIRNESILYIFL